MKKGYINKSDFYYFLTFLGVSISFFISSFFFIFSNSFDYLAIFFILNIFDFFNLSIFDFFDFLINYFLHSIYDRFLLYGGPSNEDMPGGQNAPPLPNPLPMQVDHIFTFEEYLKHMRGGNIPQYDFSEAEKRRNYFNY